MQGKQFIEYAKTSPEHAAVAIDEMNKTADDLCARIAQLEAKLANAQKLADVLLDERNEEVKKVAYWSKAHDDANARIAALEAAFRAAQMELRATQRNWDENCLYRCDDIMTRALLNDKSDEAVAKAFSGKKTE